MAEGNTSTRAALHTTWCADDDHDDTAGCLSATTAFPALGVSAWVGETSTGPRVVVDPARTLEGTPEEMAAFATWLAGFAGQASPMPTGVPGEQR